MGLGQRLDPERFGIFAESEALGELNEVDVSQTPQYYAKSRPCEHCFTRKECRIPWFEIYCLQYGVLPQNVGRHPQINRPDVFSTDWQYDPDHQCFHPGVRCNCDSRGPIVMFDITPTEAERVLHNASRNGVVDPQQAAIIRHIAPIVRSMAGVRG